MFRFIILAHLILAQPAIALASMPLGDEDRGWPDEAVEKRIQEVFSADQIKKVEVYRTEHYIILTNSSAGKSFGKILEKDIYSGVQEFLGFDEPEDEKLLPIFLFRTKDDYTEFQMKTFDKTRESAEKSKGIAYEDFYATYYESPRDPTHFHESVHQLVKNVLELSGGGSWYQEGLAEYFEDKIRKFNRFAETRMIIRTEQSMPFRQFMALPSLLASDAPNVKGSGGSSGLYGQAASLILFLKEGPQKQHFKAFVWRMGKVERGDTEAIEQVLKEVYGWSIEELEAAWREYYLE